MGSTMGILAGLWAPLRSGWRAIWRTRRAPQVQLHRHAHGLHMLAGHGQVAWPSSRTCARPVRVLRVVDAAHPRATAGRMVISGRMADVCAELDRLAALEAAAA